MAVEHVVDAGQSESKPAAHRCFIAARPQTDIRAIRALLQERGINATASYERPWLGARPLDTVMALIDDADLVIAVLDDPVANTDLGVELGYALARDKKILAVLPRDTASVPSYLASTLYIRSDTNDIEAVAYNLDALLAAPSPRRRPYIPPKADTYPIGDRADVLLGRLSQAIDAGQGAELERIVEDALRASGVSIITVGHNRYPPDSGFDIGIWSDDLESSVGNPLLIDLKLSIPTHRALKVIREQVESNARNRSVDWALVLVAAGPPDWDAVGDSEPPVLFLGLRDLIERLRTTGFAAIMGLLRDHAIRVG